METVQASACYECTATCMTKVSIKDGKVVKVAGNPEGWNEGKLCPKGTRAAMEWTYHKDRLLHPMKRVGERGDCKWERITWDEALDTVSDKLGETIQKHGPLSICTFVSRHMSFPPRGPAIQLLMRSIGSPNIVTNHDLCGGCDSVAALGTGIKRTFYYPELTKCKCIIIFGQNIAESMYPEYLKIRNAVAKGTMKLILVDPRRVPLANEAESYLQIRPSTDSALVLGMMNVIINENLYDKNFVEKKCYGFDKLKERVQEYSPEKVAKITWLSPDDIRNAARIFATNKPGRTIMHQGVNARVGGTQSCRAIYCLLGLTGNIHVRGGYVTPPEFPNFKRATYFTKSKEYSFPREIDEKMIGARMFPLYSGPDGAYRCCHTPSVIRAMLTGDPYPIKAIYVTGQNILATRPGSRDTLKAMLNMDFIVNACHRLDPTSQYADVLLPKTTTLEENVVKWHGALPGLVILQSGIEHIGECLNDLEIAHRLLEIMVKKGFIKKNWLPWKNDIEFADYQLKDTGLTFNDLKDKGFVKLPLDYKKQADLPFLTSTGKFEFYSTLFEKYQYDPMPNYSEPPHSPISTPALYEKFPLMLITGVRKLLYHHSQFRDQDWIRKKHPWPFLEIHPDTAKKKGIKDGDAVIVETPKGINKIKLRAKVTDIIHPKVVSAPMGWWLPEKPGPDYKVFEVNINAGLNYWQPWDPLIGVPDICGGELCQVTKTKES